MISRVRATGLLPLATIGMRSRPLRATLSTLGIAIGIAAIIGVLGITRSSQSDLLARIDRLGTNLLTVVNGQRVGGEEAALPQSAATGIARTSGVQRVTATAASSSTRPLCGPRSSCSATRPPPSWASTLSTQAPGFGLNPTDALRTS
ncbi:hypothetical protein Rhe02_11600 [Rhizocola hellebori]|uniref:MacB-like periplasmic core domain-containing protein n=1 Tax=Rhizocola hellebori TaxID=1392758 RepID=A0A8J3Q363_9ACTN|nr:ABC transporter permease [Rhizocola hellebori]GIH03093.1 hypothetical protein Rhe02_11600 [Rhizocola hellebori]